MNTTTIEQLAEKIGEKVWSKGDLKRIYLNDVGHNTKKMSTKTYIFQDQDGEFKVSCHVECPSQPYEWCNSQADGFKAGVYRMIENALSDTVYILTDKDGSYTNSFADVRALNDAAFFYTEAEAKEELDNCVTLHSYISMPRAEFEAEIARLEEIEANMPIKDKLERGDSIHYMIYGKRDSDERIERDIEKVFATISDMEAAGADITCSVNSDLNYVASGYIRKRKEGEETARALVEKAIESYRKGLTVQPNTTATKSANSAVIVTYGVGEKLIHGKFGVGTVVEEDVERVSIDFGGETGIKMLLKKFAALKKA